MPRVILVALVVFATIYALVDCIQTDGRLMRVMPKPVWLLVCLIPVLGPIMWLAAGRSDTPGSRGLGLGPRGGAPRRPRPSAPGPRGPDDDPDFLRRLRKPKP
ncbi:PLD nuclease N-terminal domain-containing protein [Intrasporangium sp. DVR]|uniref:PLD nuclease N-terminal domain-containing protein n=1 Tax=Intrasporangium sp. DVR TaxID=3127867 RepID=UPI00313A741B